jgi:hypothetical protein
MATLTLTIPDAQVSRVFNALAAAGSYDPSRSTKAAFAQSMIAAYIKGVVVQQEQQAAAIAAQAGIAPPDVA